MPSHDAASTPVERPYTMALRLCDGQRVDMPLLNRLRALGGHKPYPEDADIQCTGSAHLAGEHILCTSPVHGVVGKPLNGWQTVTVTNDALPERPEAVSNPSPDAAYRYRVVVYCGDCSFGQDPMGCFDGGTDELPERYADLQAARDAGADATEDCGPWGYRIYDTEEDPNTDVLVYDSDGNDNAVRGVDTRGRDGA